MEAQALTQLLRDRLFAEVMFVCIDLHVRNMKTAQEKLDGFSFNPQCEYLVNINPTREDPLVIVPLNRAGKIRTEFARAIARKIRLGRTFWMRDYALTPADPDQLEDILGARADYRPRTDQDRADRLFDQGTYHRPVQKFKGRVSVAESAAYLGYTAAQMRTMSYTREM